MDGAEAYGVATAELGDASATPRIRTMGQRYLAAALSRPPGEKAATRSESQTYHFRGLARFQQVDARRGENRVSGRGSQGWLHFSHMQESRLHSGI